MRAMDSRRDFTSKKVFSGYFSELGEKANSALAISTEKYTKIVNCHENRWKMKDSKISDLRITQKRLNI